MYFRPETIEEALAIKARYREKAAVVAGGTDLVVQMRAGKKNPEVLLDISRLPLDQVEMDLEQVRLGACVKIAFLYRDDFLCGTFPALAEAARQLGAPPVQNLATLGGNLCNASPAADCATPLLAYRAEVFLASNRGKRTVPLADFFLGPGETTLVPDELLVGVTAPRPAPGTRAAFYKSGPRRAQVISTINACFSVRVEGGLLRDPALAFGCLGPTPHRAIALERHLEGKKAPGFAREDWQPFLDQALSPISDVRGSDWYKRDLAASFLADFLEGLTP